MLSLKKLRASRRSALPDYAPGESGAQKLIGARSPLLHCKSVARAPRVV
ncbi:MAG TPA: hypothetical protein VMR33_13280 [Candidatus Baltobacteraceae bacterium]|jgi:hypothetical protein|nr:hypothetical protein [Candidatus Baltobacteraceae bacterium]